MTKIKTIATDLSERNSHDYAVNQFLSDKYKTVIKIEHFIVQPTKAATMGVSTGYNPDLVTIVTYEEI